MERSRQHLMAYFDYRVNSVFDDETVRNDVLYRLQAYVDLLIDEVAEALLKGFDLNSKLIDQFMLTFEERGADARSFAYAFMQIASPSIVRRNENPVERQRHGYQPTPTLFNL